MMKFIVIMVALLMLAGCATYYPHGAIFVDGKMGLQGGNGTGPKTGKACMTSILGLVAWGDASLEAAKAAGGITNVVNMNYEVNNILGVYGQYCLVVQGN